MIDFFNMEVFERRVKDSIPDAQITQLGRRDFIAVFKMAGFAMLEVRGDRIIITMHGSVRVENNAIDAAEFVVGRMID